MSTWSEAPTRTSVLRGGAATAFRSARIDSDLRTTAFASADVVDARLTDPHLQAVVAEASRVAVERGRAEGHVAGYAAGLHAAAAEAAVAAEAQRVAQAAAEQRRDAEVSAALEVLAAATQALLEREAVAVQEVERAVVELALDLARAVLGRELAVCSDPGRDALARALALAPEATPATARLHPDDAAALSDVAALAAGRDLVLVADASVERGGCVVDTAGRHIDAQIGPALERVAAVLR